MKRDDLLTRLLLGDEPQLRRETIRAIREQDPPGRCHSGQAQRRTVGDLFSEWDRSVQEEQRRAAEKAAREQARRNAEEARERQDYLQDLAQRMPAAWKEVEARIEDRTPHSYDRAVALLVDLREAATLVGRQTDFQERRKRLTGRHARKSTLIRRLEQAGFDEESG